MALLTDTAPTPKSPRASAPDGKLFKLAVVATGLGVLAIATAGFARSVQAGDGVIPREAALQALYAGGAAVGAVIVSRTPIEIIRRIAPSFFALCLVGLLLVKVIGIEMNGAQRWIDLGPFNIQPSEFAKLGAVLFLAWALAGRPAWTGPRRKPRGLGEWLDFVAVPKLRRAAPFLLVLVVVKAVEREPDLGTAAVIAASSIALLLVAGVSKKSLVALAALALVGVSYMTVLEPYRVQRITAHLSRWEEQHRDHVGYQTTQSEMAMASGGLIGVSPGAGRAKHMLPAATTDFVMATIAEEFGLLGAFAVLAILGLLVRRMLVLAARIADPFAQLVLYGVATWIGVQTCVNVMMANGAIPSIGIPLPFFSSGGSSLVALWLAVAVCLSASRGAVVPSLRCAEARA